MKALGDAALDNGALLNRSRGTRAGTKRVLTGDGHSIFGNVTPVQNRVTRSRRWGVQHTKMRTRRHKGRFFLPHGCRQLTLGKRRNLLRSFRDPASLTLDPCHAHSVLPPTLEQIYLVESRQRHFLHEGAVELNAKAAGVLGAPHQSRGLSLTSREAPPGLGLKKFYNCKKF